MFAVIFEVMPKPERYDHYLQIASSLRPHLLASEGFIENTRFASRRRQGLLLSLSLWRDEKALIRWRVHGPHHAAQVSGRGEILADYRLRVGEVIAHSAAAIGSGQSRLDTTEVGEAKAVVLVDGGSSEEEQFRLSSKSGAVAADCDCLDAISETGRSLIIQGFGDEKHAVEAAGDASAGGRCMAVRIIRDYGMRDRREAVQWMAPV